MTAPPSPSSHWRILSIESLEDHKIVRFYYPRKFEKERRGITRRIPTMIMGLSRQKIAPKA